MPLDGAGHLVDQIFHALWAKPRHYATELQNSQLHTICVALLLLTPQIIGNLWRATARWEKCAKSLKQGRLFCEEEDETFDHLINACACFYLDQVDLLQNQPIVKTTDWNPKTLLKFAKIETIKNALSYNDHTEYIW